MRHVALALLAACLLAACGQRGALYLPGEERERVGGTAAPATPQSAPAANTTTDDEATARPTSN
jgi:predicted small lipoprotein YifL